MASLSISTLVPRMQPFYFDGHFGFLHAADHANCSTRGVVLCGSFGIEELCTHRLMRQLGCQLATAGMTTLRFDYYGTGNSAGTHTEAASIDSWLAGIDKAREFLQRECGVTEVVLIGWRLGSLLAAITAISQPVKELVLIGPVISGHAYVREMTALREMIADTTRVGLRDPQQDQDDSLDVVGFTLTRQLVTSLQQLTLRTVDQRIAERVLVLEGQSTQATSKLIEKLRSTGSEVEAQVLPGYAEMKWDVTVANLPAHAFAGLLQWLQQNDKAPVQQHRPRPSLGNNLGAPAWHEQPIQFGPQRSLFGIWCRPRFESRHALLFVNHGANHHVGWARLHVTQARRYAAMGIASLRMDVAGLGDSPAAAGQKEHRVYASESLVDIRDAVTWLAERGYERITVIGHCSGAYLGLHAALQDMRITDAVLINMGKFFWKEGDSVEIVTRSSFNSLAWYMKQLSELQNWRRIWKREVNLSAILRMLRLKFGRRFVNTLQGLRGLVTGKPSDARVVRGWFEKLSRRRTRVLLVYSSHDGALDELALYCGHLGRRLRGLTEHHLRLLKDADHNLTQHSAQRQYLMHLDQFLELNDSVSVGVASGEFRGGMARPLRMRAASAGSSSTA